MDGSLLLTQGPDDVDTAPTDAADQTPSPAVDDLLEDVSIDGMCGVY